MCCCKRWYLTHDECINSDTWNKLPSVDIDAYYLTLKMGISICQYANI